jgi:pyridoxal phosphate enzyme (YggS family)
VNGVDLVSDVGRRLDDVRGRINDACSVAGRRPGSVSIVAVAKGFGPETVEAALANGLSTIGENRVQEAREKAGLCPSTVRWHMVGRLQTNKSRDAASLFELIHSVDSVRLLEALDRAADGVVGTLRVLLQVNVAGDAAKAGFAPEDVPAAIEAAGRLQRIEIAGLMTVPPFTADPELARPHFGRLRACREKWAAETGLSLEELSMGMSNDFEVAIREGATMVRLGTALFGNRPTGSGWRRGIRPEDV